MADDGQTLAEYALIIAVVGVVLIVAMTFLSGQISSLFSHVGNEL
jgi:Flp pilus assembly pilin Flp